MPEFAANLSLLFTEVPFLERFKMAANSGFKYVEYLFPYEWPAHVLAEQLSRNQLTQVLFNLPPGNWEAGERGIACLPDRMNEFRAGLDQSIEYARALKVKQLNCLAGITPEHFQPDALWDTLTENVAWAASCLAQHDMTLLIEPINSKVDMPGFYIDSLEKAHRLINDVNLPNIKIQFDIYHMQIMQGNIINSLEKYLPLIGHIQFADCPGRHEPGTGELNFKNIFQKLDALHYSGWASAEYIPKHNSSDSLAWLQTFN